MKDKLKSLFLYAFFWLLFFFAARLLFLIGNYGDSSELGLKILCGTFSRGLKLDISATAYILAVPMLVLLPSIWIRGEWFRHFHESLHLAVSPALFTYSCRGHFSLFLLGIQDGLHTPALS
ncbi:MAG: hypothetical protein IPI69_05290 [Bacteroidales bacterium]|nr:hypothetical protein [Bacteroidales bacterium]